MSHAEQGAPRAVPYAVEVPDRVPKERYYDEAFFRLEAEHLWPRVWQMACRLEEIPRARDYVEYENLDQSVVVVRQEDGSVAAFQNACRHRGVKVAVGQGRCESGFTCPFHGWCYDEAGRNTYVSKRGSFAEHNLEPGDLDLTPVRCETWAGWAFVNLDDTAPPLRDCIEPFATILEAWDVDGVKVEWWNAFRLPVNWKLAEAAFLEQYHVIETHPQLVDARRFPPRDPAAFDRSAWLESQLRYLRTMSEGMAGMVHRSDVAVAEQLADELGGGDGLPAGDYAAATAAWERAYKDAVVAWHRGEGHTMVDLNELEAEGLEEPMAYCFPHFFVLPMYSSCSSYRFRPLGPEETLMEIWSLTRYPADQPRPRPTPPEPLAHDDPRVPPIPIQDFSNLPRQQRGLHNRGFEYLRLAEGIEGGVANFERTVDGYLAGLPHDRLAPALREVNLNPLERPVVDLGL
ncbi:MAG: aromatic ring-hydroxylating dioxygenase subunit alpha [Acidimicrobiales bacterium]|nr:aromatic ring-hydroxylating dioxygenase subunit alpha [Acidimicrobiales bacterium]